jgi:hypothetical protein
MPLPPSNLTQREKATTRRLPSFALEHATSCSILPTFFSSIVATLRRIMSDTSANRFDSTFTSTRVLVTELVIPRLGSWYHQVSV